MTHTSTQGIEPPLDYMRLAGAPLLISAVLNLSSNVRTVHQAGSLAVAYDLLGIAVVVAIMLTLPPFLGLLASTAYAGPGAVQRPFGSWCLRLSVVLSRLLLAIAALRALCAIVLLLTGAGSRTI